MTTRIAFVDTSLLDYQALVAALGPAVEVVLINPGQDGWQQVAAALAGRSGIGAIDIFSHGAPGSVTLGSGVLTASTLPAYAATLAEIGSHLAAGADILLYGCAVGAGSTGQDFLNLLAAASGADVAASTDTTGAAALGGNWVLEATAGPVETAALQAPAYQGSLAEIIGTPNADTLNGSVVDDAIFGLAGNDTLNGFGGNDLLDGGTGFDFLFGGQGNDTLLAGNDADGSQLFGEDGDDTLTGSGGSDSLRGDAGSDVLNGGDGNDALRDFDFSGLLASNSLDAGAGDDTIDVYQSNAGSVTTVSGGGGRDTYLLQPNSTGQLLASDFAPGASGDILNINQLLINSSGYSGGNPFDPALGYLRLVQQGADTLLQWDRDGTAVASNGWQTIITLQNTVAATLTTENFAPAAPPDGSSLGLTLTGTPNADTLNGSVVDDAIFGLAGNDTLNGFGGNDLLDGGTGFDFLFGGQGNDTLLAGNDADGSQLFGEDGDDTLTGSGGSDSLRGDAGSDVLNGGDGNDALRDFDFSGLLASNSLDAGAGDDTIDVYQSNAGSVTTVSGGGGRDTYLLQPNSTGQLLASDFAPGASGDILNINQLLINSSGYSGGNPFDPALGYLRLVQQGADTLLQWDRDGTAVASNGWQTIITLQNTVAATLTTENFAPAAPPDGSSVGLTLTGTPNADTLNGSVVDDAIFGLAGNDTLNGFGGNDLLDGGTGFDFLFGGQGNDTLLAGNDADGSALFGEDGDDTLTGSGGSDSLRGDAGSDVLQGGNGNDALRDFDFSGLLASNSLDAGAGDDTIDVYQSNAGSVTTVSGGGGRDTYLLQPNSTGQLLASDFAAGASGDILNINQLLINSSGYSGGNPFDAALGYLRLVQQGADTLLQWDQNGTATGGNGWQTIITLQNTTAATLTAENFAPATGITTIEVVVLNAAPVVSAPLADQPAAEDAGFSFVVPAGSFSDPDAGDTLSYSAILANGAALPAWLSFDATTRRFSGTPAQADVGAIDVRVTATDAAGLSANDVFTLTVGNVNDAPSTTPVILALIAEDSGARLISQAELLANASDVDGDSLTASNLAIASGLGSLVDNLDGTWSYTPALNDDSTVSFSYTVGDGSLTAAGSATLDIAAVNDAPLIATFAQEDVFDYENLTGGALNGILMAYGLVVVDGYRQNGSGFSLSPGDSLVASFGYNVPTSSTSFSWVDPTSSQR
ncbi:DUF4347 domain-containing protein [Polaromonas sp. P1(28)-13]|nr:DUF4347 domain-containing protein [Polaromonas sp. P1(28)-13]